ncbi:MAG: zinc-dependent peptidase [Reichenbachiella sp.]
MGFQVPGFPTPLLRSRKRILSQHFKYYSQLTATNKKIFEHRVQEFISRKQFIPRDLERVTEEMRVLIAACAVQLTFGYPNVFLSHFKRILIYPNDYYSTINKTFHKGEVNPKLRAIVISWHHFVSGYVDYSDGINLGLHEMTHALHLENRIFNHEYNFIDRQELIKWHKLSQEEIKKLSDGQDHFFRNYAKTNAEEFLAIAVENFFEKSVEFKKELPELYKTLSVLLNQDPLKN